MTEVAVLGIGLFSPGYPNAQVWQSREPNREHPKPQGEFIDARSRRRASNFTRALADAYGEALLQSDVPAADVAAVFGSSIGEANTMIDILNRIFRDEKAVSPMQFAMSVHNAASGMMSTTSKNRGFTTSLGADFDTPAMSLLEGIALVQTNDSPVLVVCGDEQVPEDLVRDNQGWQLLSVALVIAPAGPSSAMTVSLPTLEVPDADAIIEPQAIDEALCRNPTCGMLDMANALLSKSNGFVKLDRGRGRGFYVQIKCHD